MAKKLDGDINIGTKIDTSGAEDGIKSLTSQLKNFTKVVKGSAVYAAVTKAFQLTTKAINETTAAYKTQINAEKSLEVAARNNPYLDNDSIKQLKSFASEMQSIGTVGDESIIPLMAQLASAGRTQAEIQNIISTALDISASGVMSLDSAVTNLNATYSGNIGLLGRQYSDLKNLTDEDLKNGKAVELLASKYKGMAKEIAETTGTTEQFKNAWGDAKEEIGALFEQKLNPMRKFFTQLITGWTDAAKARREYNEAQNKKDEGKATTVDYEKLISEEQKQVDYFKATVDKNLDILSDENKLKQAIEASDYTYDEDFFKTALANAQKDYETHYSKLQTLQEEADALKKTEEAQKKQTEADAAAIQAAAEKAAAEQKEIETRMALRDAYDETIRQKESEIKQRRALGEVITEQQEAQELLDTATEAYVTMMSDPAFIGNNGTFAHEVDARKQIAEYAEKAAVDIKEIKYDSMEAARSLIESLSGSTIVDNIDATIEALKEEANQFSANSTQYEFYVNKISELSELKRQQIQKTQKEEMLTTVNNISGYVTQYAEIVKDVADLAISNTTEKTEEQNKELAKSYSDGLISYEEYCTKKSELSKQQAKDEYKYKLWEWEASLLEAAANIATGVTKAIEQGGTLGLITGALVSAAGAVQIATITANKPKPAYAKGGIVGGTSFTGDHIDARLNSGEMVLNAAQQASLWKLANGGNNVSTALNMAVNIENKNGSAVDAQLTPGGLQIIIDNAINAGLQTGKYSQSLKINNYKDAGVKYL